jgi:hypothetical protein
VSGSSWCCGCQGQVCAVALALCLCSAQAQAKSSRSEVVYSYDTADNPIAEFTRSLTQLNHVSQMCRGVETADYSMYSLLIQQYVKLLYKGDAPYWVLSEVKDHIDDQTICKFLVTESLVHYQFAYRDFVDVTRPQVMPPILTESMSQPGHAPIDTMTLGVARPSAH